MIHLSKYDCVAVDNLAFKGGISTRGTTFHCKACDKPAFKIKGVLDEAAGTERVTFLQGLKARHAEHAKVCWSNAPPSKETDGSGDTQPEVTSATTVKQEAEKPNAQLDPSNIGNWTETDVYDWMSANDGLPADIKSYSFHGYYNPDKKLTDDLRNMLNLDRHMAIIFENACGLSRKIRVSKTHLSGALPPETYSRMRNEHAACVRNLIVDAKVKKMAAAVCKKVAKSYPCGIRKQRLQDKFDRLYKINPDKLSKSLDMLESGVL